MKHLLLLLGFAVLSCTNETPTLPQAHVFHTIQDTLIIETTKVVGIGPFITGAGPAGFKNLSYDEMTIYKLPEGLDSIKKLTIGSDIWDKNRYEIPVISGRKDGESIYIIDRNNNNDFSDDPTYPIQPINWDTIQYPAQCNYPYELKNGIIKNISTYIEISSNQQDNYLYLRKAEHLISTFTIGDDQYKIGIIADENFNTLNYNVNPKLWLLPYDDSQPTINAKDMVTLGEYVKLGNNYYKFATISTYGKELTLIKEPDFNKKTGLQKGMLAPAFEAITTDGTSINSSNLHDQPIIIANSCGCGGDTESTTSYEEMYNTYNSKAHVFHLDNHIKNPGSGIHIDTEKKENKLIDSLYRQQYCSRWAYLIGPDNRILNKFELYDWEQELKTHLKL